MSKNTSSNTSVLGYLFAISLLVTLVVYLMRGLGILTFIPGGIILFLFALSILTGIIYGIAKTWRY
ncbi:hypothetical protein NIES593_09545 [Hydrococcus rivularis NIES-593]|uniref:Uncharacterized protein n=1 Tax=Hydrococcus rivularis NIES-593 TaxID=1921803 RepID=A0A1U7HIU4_9CYAN|nr:hypothetical protein NIES593_09545 [Hydrococcus rivularis NIES-593]